jgi:hypothetical protein
MGEMLGVYPFQRKKKSDVESEKWCYWKYIKVFLWKKYMYFNG